MVDRKVIHNLLDCSAIVIMLIRVVSNAICSVLTTFPSFGIFCVVLHLHAADFEATWPIKCVIIYLFPPFFKNHCLFPVQSAEDTIRTTCYSTHDLWFLFRVMLTAQEH